MYTPLIIIGAPRSGTNMLRDALTQLPGYATWPCDEINYIWRHGNTRYPTDEFPAALARPNVCRSIRRRFDDLARRSGAQVVVEKTCANSLRVPFVDAIIPDARYIFISRDGYDVVGSAAKRWRAELDLGYLAAKVRFVPISDIPYYGVRYLWNRIYRLTAGRGQLAFWGPQWNGMDDAMGQPAETLGALQWQACVERSLAAFSEMPVNRWTGVSYETFVERPATELRRALNALDLPVSDDAIRSAVAAVSVASIGKGKQQLGEPILARLAPLIGQTRRRLGYE
ncbi:MAG: sulfotransferase [Gammaproteobacteria bacterium]